MMMVAAKNLRKSYRPAGQLVRAVDDVHLECRKGDYISIVGHSGSGKSTLLSLIGGLAKPDTGTVVIDGTDILSLSDNALSELRNSKLNFIFQFASLVPTLTAMENVILPVTFSSLRGRRKEETKAEAVRLLETVGLQDKLYAYPSQLSGGQQRRVAIARAFINSPEIILADEPTGDLDEETEENMVELFNKMNKEREITFIVVTHNSVLASRAKRMFRMSNGALEEI